MIQTQRKLEESKHDAEEVLEAAHKAHQVSKSEGATYTYVRTYTC